MSTAELSTMLVEGKQPTQAEGVADALGAGTGITLVKLEGAGQTVRVNGAVRAAELELMILGIGTGEKLIVAFLLSVEKGGAGRSVLETLTTEVVAASVVVERAGVLKLVSESVDADSVVAESVVVGTDEISELELGLWLTMMVLVTCVVE